jgi:hypothetical protein
MKSMNPADYATVIMILTVVAYGIHQYVKREKEHRALLQTISQCDIASPSAIVEKIKPAPWRFIALVVGELLLIAHLIWRVATAPDVWGGARLMGFLVTIYLMMALPGVLGLLKRALWRLMTLCFIEMALVASVLWLLNVRSKIIYGGELTYVIAFLFVAVFLVLLPMVMRDIRAYRSN